MHYMCISCGRETILDIHGRCEVCQSDAVCFISVPSEEGKYKGVSLSTARLLPSEEGV